jgi:NhaA family Na+:H+ antiporter
MNWGSLYGIALLCGVGFTMSLFMGGLAFEETGVKLVFDQCMGLIIGSLVSGIAGYIVLRFSLSKSAAVAVN